jgi:hypothetical protein
MRNLVMIIDKIIELIPRSFAERESLIGILEDNKSSYAYAAPEMRSFWWKEVAMNLEAFLGVPDEPWKKTISDLFSDRN